MAWPIQLCWSSTGKLVSIAGSPSTWTTIPIGSSRKLWFETYNSTPPGSTSQTPTVMSNDLAGSVVVVVVVVVVGGLEVVEVPSAATVVASSPHEEARTTTTANAVRSLVMMV